LVEFAQACADARGTTLDFCKQTVFELGVLAFEVLGGGHPIDGYPHVLLADDGPYTVAALPPVYPEGLNAMCRRMVAREPSLRPDFHEAVAVLKALSSSLQPAATAPQAGPQSTPLVRMQTLLQTCGAPAAASTLLWQGRCTVLGRSKYPTLNLTLHAPPSNDSFFFWGGGAGVLVFVCPASRPHGTRPPILHLLWGTTTTPAPPWPSVCMMQRMFVIACCGLGTGAQMFGATPTPRSRSLGRPFGCFAPMCHSAARRTPPLSCTSRATGSRTVVKMGCWA
jgi:hypothetical protein